MKRARMVVASQPDPVNPLKRMVGIGFKSSVAWVTYTTWNGNVFWYSVIMRPADARRLAKKIMEVLK